MFSLFHWLYTPNGLNLFSRWQLSKKMLTKRERDAHSSFFASIYLKNSKKIHPTSIFGCKKGCKSRNYLIYTLCCGERGIGLALRAVHSLCTRRRALAELLQLVCRWHTRAVLYFFPRSSKLSWGKNKNSPALCAELHFCGERGSRTYAFKKYHKIANH